MVLLEYDLVFDERRVPTVNPIPDLNIAVGHNVAGEDIPDIASATQSPTKEACAAKEGLQLVPEDNESIGIIRANDSCDEEAQ